MGLKNTNNLLLLALTLHNIECRLIIMTRPYSNNLHLPVFTYYDCTRSSFRFQYRLLTVTIFFEVAVNKTYLHCVYQDTGHEIEK